MFQGLEIRQHSREVARAADASRGGPDMPVLRSRDRDVANTPSRWLDENADAFAGQAEWHERNDHPLADILVAPGKATWRA